MPRCPECGSTDVEKLEKTSTVAKASTGAVVGGILGSIIPFVGTAIGAGIGGAIGGIDGVVTCDYQCRDCGHKFDL